MSKLAKLPDCTCGDDIDVGHKPNCRQGAFLVAEARKIERQYQKTERMFKRSVSIAAHKMLDDLLKTMMDDLVIHGSQGRGFRVNIQIVEASGMPYKPDPAPEPLRERLIIGPHEQ